MKAFIFPGQASQFVGMGQDLDINSNQIRSRLDQAKEILGFDIAEVMTDGDEEDLRQTKVTQPAVFLHSVLKAELEGGLSPDAVAGHSLGEFSALVCNGVLTFEVGLALVKVRAEAMQKACEISPGTMAAIVGMDDGKVEEICDSIDGIVIAANYNCPGQLVISGEIKAIESACAKLTEAGAKRAITLSVGGAFHSPLMQPASDELAQAVQDAKFSNPSCPIYQNVNGLPQTDHEVIKENLILQLTSPVRWTTTIEQMISDGITNFTEVGGTGKVLQAMVRRISREVVTGAL